MKYNVAYEVVDSRRVEPARRMGVVACLQTCPGGFDIVSCGGVGLRVDDSFGFDDDHQRGIVAISNHEGRVTLTELTLQRYHDTVEPFVRQWVPEFHSEGALHAGLIAMILED